MRKKSSLILLVLAMFVLCTGFSYAAAKPITITLDGKQVVTDTEPVIKEGRTLVPVAVIVDNIGGKAVWDGKTREVTVTYKDTTVKLKIDSKDAYINDKKTTLDVPATIINSRTIVPLRFISEALQYDVGYDDANRVVSITSPNTSAAAQKITAVSMTGSDDACRVEVKAASSIGNYTTLQLSAPDRFVVDVKKASLVASGVDKSGNNSLVASVRISQFTSEDTRIVIDLNQKTAPVISVSEDKTSLYLDFGNVNQTDINRGNEIDRSTLPEEETEQIYRPTDENFLVIIDPGHGGADPGALGKENGKTVLLEKDLNLAISLRIRELLEEAGIATYMTREKDNAVILASRPAIANSMNATLFVSIHNNASESTATNGMEVMYYEKATDASYGMGTSKDIANVVGNYMKSEMGSLGLSFNKYSSRPALAVLNKTSMPAILVEGAYLSNQSDRNIMKTAEFIEQYAQAVAKGIIEVVNRRSF